MSPTADLEDGVVHVWTFELSADNIQLDYFWRLLSEEERDRAGRYQFPALRHSFAISHGVLRILLGRYLQCQPALVAYAHGAFGKPALAGSSRLRFNLSHSDNIGIYAFALNCDVGVDIERMRPVEELGAVATEHFCPDERFQILSLTPEERIPAFFRCWTRKEAYVKATGFGLATPLDGIRVGLSTDDSPRLIVDGLREFTLHPMTLHEDYIGALVYEKGDPRPVILRGPFSINDLLQS